MFTMKYENAEWIFSHMFQLT